MKVPSLLWISGTVTSANALVVQFETRTAFATRMADKINMSRQFRHVETRQGGICSRLGVELSDMDQETVILVG